MNAFFYCSLWLIGVTTDVVIVIVVIVLFYFVHARDTTVIFFSFFGCVSCLREQKYGTGDASQTANQMMRRVFSHQKLDMQIHVVQWIFGSLKFHLIWSQLVGAHTRTHASIQFFFPFQMYEMRAHELTRVGFRLQW